MSENAVQSVLAPSTKRRFSKVYSKRTNSVKGRSNSERSMSELSLESTVSNKALAAGEKPVYRDIALKEMMQYYTPRWMAVAGFAASFVSAFQLPMFGYILSQYVFVLAEPVDTPENKA